MPAIEPVDIHLPDPISVVVLAVGALDIVGVEILVGLVYVEAGFEDIVAAGCNARVE